MNGIRVIRTIGFDLTVGSECMVEGKTYTVRGFDLEREVVTLEVVLDDVFLQTQPLSEVHKKVRDLQVPVARVVGTGTVSILRDRLLTIGDIPYGQSVNDNK